MDIRGGKLLLAALALPAVIAVAVACGDDDDSNDSGSKFGGEIVIQSLEFTSFDPHFSSFSMDLMHQKQVFRGLYDLNVDAEPIPEMASDAAVSDDGLTYTITLKDGLVWSDGEALTAHDFVLGIQRTCNYGIAGDYQYVLDNIVGCDEYYDPENAEKSAADIQTLLDGVAVVALDDKTIEYTLESPQPTFLTRLSLWATWPVPSHIVPDPGAPWPDPTELVYNGPFVVESFSPGESMVFVRNDNYAGDHVAYLDKVTFRYIEDTAVANNAFRSGELMMALADSTNFESLQSEFPNELVSQAGARTRALQMQMDHPPLDNLDVRLALARAIDRETLNSVVLQNANVPTTTWVPAQIVGIEDGAFDDVIGFDVGAAQQHLADAGYPGGEGFPELSILVRDSASERSLAQFYQSEFKKHLGINTTIEVVDARTRGQRFFSEEFELFPGGWNQDYSDPENWLVGLFETEGVINFYNCSLPEIDDLIEKAKFNPNDEERREQFREVNRLIVENVCGAAPTHHPGNNYLISEKLGGAREFATTSDFVLAGDWASEEWYLTD